MKDVYETFAYDYDEFGAIDDYLGAEKTFFQRLVNKYHVRSVLDCACGTGQHLSMLSDLGLNVVGSDFSSAMLEVAKKNLIERGIQLPLYQSDFRSLEAVFSEKFDAVVCLTTSLPHLQTEEDLITALKSMKERLNPSGLLVLTTGTTHYNLALPPIEVVVNREDFSRIFVKEQDEQFQTIHVLDLYHSEKRLESNQYDIVYKIILDEDYRQLLRKAGFQSIKIYGDYEGHPYDKNSQRMIIVAQTNAA